MPDRPGLNRMNDAPTSTRSTCITLLALGGLTAWLLILRPGQLAPGNSNAELVLSTTLVGAYSLYLLSWKTHGIFVGIFAATIFLVSNKQPPDYPTEGYWLFEQMLILTCVGFHVIAWSYMDHSRLSRPHWAILAACIVGISTLAWIE